MTQPTANLRRKLDALLDQVEDVAEDLVTNQIIDPSFFTGADLLRAAAERILEVLDAPGDQPHEPGRVETPNRKNVKVIPG